MTIAFELDVMKKIAALEADNERLRAALRRLDAMIFEAPQVIDSAGELRAVIWNALCPDATT